MERTRINPWQTIAEVTPLFWVLIAAAVTIGIGEIMLLVIARRRLHRAGDAGGAGGSERPPASWLAIAAVAGPLVLAGLVVASIKIGHASHIRGLAAGDPGDSIALIKAGMNGFLNAQALGPMLLLPVLLLATAAASLHASAALKIRARPCVVVSLIFVGAGLGPFLWGAWAYSVIAIKTLSDTAGVDPTMKEMMVTKGLEETRAILNHGAVIGAAGFVAALIVAIVVAVAGDIRPRPGRGGWLAALLCLAAAAGLFALTEPLRHENLAPWPPSPCAALTNNRLPTPDVDGPDVIPRAEVVGLTNTRLLGDGVPRDIIEWRNMIVTMRNNYNLLHPAEETDESLVVVCAPDTKTERLVEILQVAKDFKYRRPAFAFGKETTIERPVLGKLRRWQWTAAKALIPGVGPETPAPIVTLKLADHPNCDAVARAVAAVRRTGKYPGLAF